MLFEYGFKQLNTNVNKFNCLAKIWQYVKYLAKFKPKEEMFKKNTNQAGPNKRAGGGFFSLFLSKQPKKVCAELGKKSKNVKRLLRVMKFISPI